MMRMEAEGSAPTAAKVRSALDALLKSPQFAGSARAARFIRFVVETALDGREETLKEYVLGTEVFDRGAAFDPGSDTIVRVEAVKLRKRLRAYYRGPGRNDPVVIDVPKGGYVPQFRIRTRRSAPGGPRRTGKRHTEKPAAFELYLKGRHLLDRFDIQSQREALQTFEAACAADPHYPLPLLGIARGLMNLAMLGAVPPREIVPRAKAALQQALAFDAGLAEAHSLMASLVCRHEWDWAEAERHYRVALRLAPHAADVHDEYATTYLAPLGRIENALAENRIARELNPFSPQLDRSYAFILLLARRLPDAERECRRMIEKHPHDGYARLVLALALHGQRRIREALAEYERLYASDPSLQHEAYVADVRALCGDRTPAEELLRRLTERAGTEFIPAMIFAWLHLHLGRLDEALTALEQAFHNREYELLVANVGYGFDSFRAHPRFRAIVEKLGLP